MPRPRTPSATRSEQDARITAHDSLAGYWARRFFMRPHGDLSLDDLTGEARLALVQAAGRFDPSRGVQFSTYASAVILGALRHLLRDKGHLVRWRRAQRRPPVMPDAVRALARACTVTVPVDDLAGAEPTDPQDVERDVVSSIWVRQLLGCLDVRTRRLVHACWIRGQPQARAGKTSGLSQREVSRLLIRARHTLAQAVRA